MKKIPKFLISASVFLMLIMPVLSLAYSLGDPLVPCGTSDTKACDFTTLMTLVNNLITFVVKYMAVPIAAIMFTYAGFLLITAGEEISSARTKAKAIFLNAVIGLALAVACWIIVKTILSIVGYKDASWIGF